MFSLIITLISIALVAALALATIYFGGSAFNKGSREAEASRLVLEGQQLLGAGDLYKADMGSYPLALADLVTENYLKQIPAGMSSWAYPQTSGNSYSVAIAEKDLCMALNARAYGVEAIPKKAYADLMYQCFGEDESSLLFLVSKDPAGMLTATGDSALVASGSHTGAVTADYLEPPAGSSGTTPPVTATLPPGTWAIPGMAGLAVNYIDGLGQMIGVDSSGASVSSSATELAGSSGSYWVQGFIDPSAVGVQIDMYMSIENVSSTAKTLAASGSTYSVLKNGSNVPMSSPAVVSEIGALSGYVDDAVADPNAPNSFVGFMALDAGLNSNYLSNILGVPSFVVPMVRSGIEGLVGYPMCEPGLVLSPGGKCSIHYLQYSATSCTVAPLGGPLSGMLAKKC